MPKTSVKSKIEVSGLRRDSVNDISDWERIQIELKGTRVKAIFRRPRRNQLFLFKQPNNPNEITNEVFNSVLANELGIDHVEYFPASYQGNPGVICERFIAPDEQHDQLWEMRELLFRHSTKLQKKGEKFFELFGRDKEVMEEHNIENLFLVLQAEFGEESSQIFFK